MPSGLGHHDARTESRLGTGRTRSLLSLWQDLRAGISGARVIGDKDKAAITEGMMTTTQQRDLHGLKALVTGATSGLGRAIAFQLAREGADVTVHGRDAARGAQAVEEIQLRGGSAHFVAADLNDRASVTRL